MNTINKIIPLLFLTLLLTGCDSQSPQDELREPEPIRPLTQAEVEVIRSDNVFGLNMFSALSAGEPNESMFISPLSVSMALGMTLNGAEGDTRTEMIATLQKQGLTEDAINDSYRTILDLLSTLDPNVDLNVANSIWYKDEFDVLPAFLEVNKTNFDAEVAALDFSDEASLDTINDWVDEKTNGLIDRIIEQIKPEDIMYLINAVYFKGSWTYQFDEDLTSEEVFQSRDGRRNLTPMMKLSGTVPYAASNDVQLIDLPYGDSLFSMTIVLPNDPDSFDQIASSITSSTWNDWTEHLEPTNLSVSLPRFKLSYKKPLNDILIEMGMKEAFNEQNADFTRINATQQLYISEVLHKSFIEVNEEGTEAAAVTAVTIGTTSVGGGPAVFRVDRPFIFSIRERHSGSILFIGKVLNL
ncbi:MAG: serpin family protein [Rhodothermales bacterium]